MTRASLFRIATLSVMAAAALVLPAAPSSADTFGTLRCVPHTNGNNRTLTLCAQVELVNGKVRADVSVHCLNAANQEYPCRSIRGGVISLYRNGSPLLPQSSMQCGGTFPACGAPTNGFSLNDPNRSNTDLYQAVFRADQIDTFDSSYFGFGVTSGSANI
jgi:hypothetical protein